MGDATTVALDGVHQTVAVSQSLRFKHEIRHKTAVVPTYSMRRELTCCSPRTRSVWNAVHLLAVEGVHWTVALSQTLL